MNAIAELLEGLAASLRQRAARAMPGPMLVRLVLWAAAVAGYALAYPAELVYQLRGSLLLTVVALIPVLRPRGLAPTATIVAIAFGWLVATSAYLEPVTTWRLVAVAGALYLVHSGAALAAVLPYDTVVSPGVLTRWAARVAGVLGITGVFAALAVAGAERLAGPTFVLGAVLGVAVAGVLAVMLVRR